MAKREQIAATRHFPKKGERFVDGEWVMPKTRRGMSAVENRDWLRKQAGWPPLRTKTIPSEG